MNPPAELIEALRADTSNLLQGMGIAIGKLYTDHGLPLDMALSRLNHSKQQQIAILAGAQSWLITHRRQSAATDKALDRQRTVNREAMQRFIITNETGVY